MALRHPIMQNRMIAIELLGQIGSEEAMSEFEKMLEQDDELYDYFQLREVLLALDTIDTPRCRLLILRATGHRSILISKLAADLAMRLSGMPQDSFGANNSMNENKEGASSCVFCRDFGNKVELSNGHFYAIYDAYPVNAGHLLIISRRHVPDLFGLNAEEFASMHDILASSKTMLDERYHPGGYNLGANCGVIAGQTIPHFHLHVIPRYEGDVDRPRGGIRNIKEPLVPYPAES